MDETLRRIAIPQHEKKEVVTMAEKTVTSRTTKLLFITFGIVGLLLAVIVNF
jgi:hypothetical protein